jgi:hypothetical protein
LELNALPQGKDVVQPITAYRILGGKLGHDHSGIRGVQQALVCQIPGQPVGEQAVTLRI